MVLWYSATGREAKALGRCECRIHEPSRIGWGKREVPGRSG